MNLTTSCRALTPCGSDVKEIHQMRRRTLTGKIAQGNFGNPCLEARLRDDNAKCVAKAFGDRR